MRISVTEGHITRFVNIPDKPVVITPAEAKEAGKKKTKKDKKEA